MRSKIFRSLWVFMTILFVLYGCNYPGVGNPTSVGPTSVGPTQVGPTGVGPTKVPNLITIGLPLEDLGVGLYFDMSPIIRVPGGDVTLPDGSRTHADDFWGYLSLVSNEQYASCEKAGACNPPNPIYNPQYQNPQFQGIPVMGISVDQAQAYCKWMNGVLPSTAQNQLLESALHQSGKNLYSGPGGPGTGFYLDDTPNGGEVSIKNADGNITPIVNKDVLDYGITCVVNGGYAPMCNMKPINPQSILGVSAVPAAPACKPEATFEIVGQFCSNGIPSITVDITGVDGPGSIIDVGNGLPFNCTPDIGNSPPGKVRMVCSGANGAAGYLKAFVPCTTPAGWKENEVCMNQYVYDPGINICVYTPGSDIVADSFCPVGYTYSSDLKCCAAVTKDYTPLCPPGQLYIGDATGCVSYDALAKPSYFDVQLMVCSSPGGDNGGNNGGATCNISCPAADCHVNTNCECVANGSETTACKP